MSKLIIGLGILLVIAMASPAMAGPVYMVNGGGWYYPSESNWKNYIGFNAQININGIVKGNWGMMDMLHGYGTLDGPVTGLIVNGNKAVIGGVIAHALETPSLEGKNICWVVVDNGQGRRVMDQISGTYIEPISVCQEMSLSTKYFHGNIVVKSFKTLPS